MRHTSGSHFVKITPTWSSKVHWGASWYDIKTLRNRAVYETQKVVHRTSARPVYYIFLCLANCAVPYRFNANMVVVLVFVYQQSLRVAVVHVEGEAYLYVEL